MNSHTRRTTVIAVIVAVLAALVAGGGVWLAQRGGGSPPAATGVTAVPTPTTSPTTPQPQTMTVRSAGSTSCWSPACRRCLPTRSEALWHLRQDHRRTTGLGLPDRLCGPAHRHRRRAAPAR